MMSAVGDAVQVLPVVNALKRAFPRARLTWLVQPPAFSLVAGHPAVDELVVFHRDARGRRPRALWKSAVALGRTAAELRRAGQRQPGGCFDLLLDLQVYLKAGILTALAPGRVKLGFDRRRARDLNTLFTTHRIPPCPGGCAHTQDQYFEFLRYLGVDPEPVEYGLEPTPPERIEQSRFFAALQGPACSVVMATSDPRRDWYPDRYARVTDGLHFDLGLHPILVGGGSPRERRMAREVMKRTEAPVLDAMRDDLRRLLWLLEGSALVISPDTGPLHMARAVDVPVVGLFGFTNPKRSGPYRRFEELVVDGYARYPGEAYGISRERRREGMGRVTPEMVLEKSELALERYGPPKG
jgi:heptosyltransferase I